MAFLRGSVAGLFPLFWAQCPFSPKARGFDCLPVVLTPSAAQLPRLTRGQLARSQADSGRVARPGLVEELAGRSRVFHSNCPALDHALGGAKLRSMEPLANHSAPVNSPVRIRHGKRHSLRQVTDLQHVTHEVALLVAKDAKDTAKPEERARAASALANLGKSWNTLQDAKRVILGRPLPGSLRPEKAKPRHSVYSQTSFTED